MPTRILGLSAFYHDSAAALVVDGCIVAAAQEERFTRKRHDASFPAQAVAYCLREAGITAADLDHVVFYEKPLLKFERLLDSHVAGAPWGYRAFLQAIPLWLHQKLHLPRELARGLGGEYRHRFIFPEHHESHAASAFYPSPFDEAAILTVDGVGEWATASIAHGRGRTVSLRAELQFPHSLGLLYSAFTGYCGFRVNSGEYKLMGLAPYGRPVYAGLIRRHLIDLRDDGSFRLDLSYFNYVTGLTMTSPRFHQLFGGEPRPLGSRPTEREADLAASVQQVTEEILVRMARHARALTGSRHLCLAGGVALNCVANGRLRRETDFDRIWIQPAAGDAGGALGAALFVWHQLLENPRTPTAGDGQRGSLLGPEPTADEIEDVLRSAGAVYRRIQDESLLLAETATALAAGEVVGWVQGRMEYGPRALGARSILGDPRDPGMQRRMNLKTKFRESFRPFAPVVRRERASEFFDLPPGDESPYMLLVAPVRSEHRRPAKGSNLAGLERVNDVRSTLPAVTHVDYSARVQTADAGRFPRLYRLLEAFEVRTGCPVLINTSFNIRGEPIVCTAGDALRCFLATDLDRLVIGDYVVRRADQPESLLATGRAHRDRFGDD